MTSAPRGPVGSAAAPPPGAPPPGAPPAPPRPAPPPAPAGARRRSRSWLDVAAKVNDCMSCHDCTAPVARLRSSTRRGGAGGAPVPARAFCPPVQRRRPAPRRHRRRVHRGRHDRRCSDRSDTRPSANRRRMPAPSRSGPRCPDSCRGEADASPAWRRPAPCSSATARTSPTCRRRRSTIRRCCANANSRRPSAPFSPRPGRVRRSASRQRRRRAATATVVVNVLDVLRDLLDDVVHGPFSCGAPAGPACFVGIDSRRVRAKTATIRRERRAGKPIRALRET